MRSSQLPSAISADVVVRIVADALLINLAIGAALVARYVNVPTFDGLSVTRESFWEYLSYYRNSVIAFTPLALLVLYFHGIYTRVRSYRRRAKVFLVLRAVSTAYLIFGFVVFQLNGALYMPRGAVLFAWAFTCAFMIAARLWTWLWVKAAGYVVDRQSTSIEDRAIGRVLVIGGGGYIGSEVIQQLIAKDYSVRVLDVLLYGSEPLAAVLNHPRLEIIKDDFRRIDTVVEAMRDVDAVIHLGAIVGDPACAIDEGLTVQINLTATRMIAEVAKGHGVNRFLFASSCSVYGASDEILDELSALNPVSLYARSKIASEHVLQSMADQRFAPVILRFGTIYGLSGRTRFDLVVNLMAAKALFQGSIDVFGGDQWRPFVHVADAARAVVECLEAPLAAVRNRAFNVGSDAQNYTIRQAADIVAALVPGVTVNERTDVIDKRNYRVSFKALNAVIGFEPRWTLEAGIMQVIDAVRAGKIVNYEDPKYNNARFLSEEVRVRLGREQANWEEDLMRRVTTTTV
ncbi:MAG: NAD(P)-dependent oxidoreductase [Cyanobacteria bacterium]|nr:NAD(P)-dependent oxidoreductase [Cyanobacteriota bacterium]